MAPETAHHVTTDELTCDAAVIGGGLAGLAASIHLARAGFRVICFEPLEKFEQIVGESLDWSAPELLKQIGLGMEELVQSRASTYKRHVILRMAGEAHREYVPSPWLGEPPLNIELRTLHVDRRPLHHSLMKIAEAEGISILHDRVTGVDGKGRVIVALRTAGGLRVAAKLFIDASGFGSSFLGREFRLRSAEYGPRKVAIWGHFKASDWQEGTILYANAPERQYMEWVWEIPINPETVSIGYVSTGAAIKRKREQSLSVQEIFAQELAKFPPLRHLLRDQSLPAVNVTSFTCRTLHRVCGPNWIIIGEAASVPDPITGNGVTAALRHAAEACTLICRFRTRRRISLWAQAAYNLRVLHMGKFFNSLIEKLAYDWPIRDRIGLLAAGDAYTIPAWSINQLYSRIRPDGMLSSALFSLFLGSLRCAAWLFYRLCKTFPAPSYVLPESASRTLLESAS